MRTAIFLVLAGSLGIGMHLMTSCLGYYLILYLFSFFMGTTILVLENTTELRSSVVEKSLRIVSLGFVLVTLLTTLSFYRNASRSNIRDSNAGMRQMTKDLEALPKPEKGLRKIAALGNWLGLYGVRLSGSQIYADFPDDGVLLDPSRFERASEVLKKNGVVAVLAPVEIAARYKGAGCHVIDQTSWCLITLE